MTEDIEQLEYDKKWVDFGLLSLDKFREQLHRYRSGHDNNKEHYRYTTFKDFLNSKDTLTDQNIYQLFELIKVDNDKSMATTMGLDILKRKSLTQTQLDLVSSLLIESFGDYVKKYIDKEISRRANRPTSQ